MTNFTSLFDSIGSEKIILKTPGQETFHISKILKIGYLKVVRKTKNNKKNQKRFLLTKDNLYFLSGSIRREGEKLLVTYKARTELDWTQAIFHQQQNSLTDKASFSFQFVKKNKTVKFQANTKGDFEIWKRLLSDITIRRDFFEEFKVVSIMGEGSSAKVYKIQNNSSSEFFACKRFKKNDLSNSQVISIVNEIKILRRLKGHPGVIKLEGVFESDNSVYLVMELCEGGRCLKRRMFYKPNQIKNLLSQVLNTLKFMKEKGVVHRDLKPDNILLKYKDMPLEMNEVRIVDFGLSSIIEEGHIRRGGTVGYMAPESLSGSGYQPHYQFDIFSIGVMAYNGLTATKLFKDKRSVKMVEKNRKAKIDFSDDVFNRIDSDCWLISKRTYCGYVGKEAGRED